MLVPLLSSSTTASGGINPAAPDFHVPFADLGDGEVDLTLTAGSGVATFTRATAASVRLSDGLWKTDVASGVPRSFYYPGGVYGGYLGEPARTNIVLWSNDFTQAEWVKSNMSAAMTATGPDGVTNSASTLTATAGNATVLQTTVAGSTARIVSCFAKRRTGTGTIEITKDNGSTWTAIAVTANWTQLSGPTATSGANPIVGLRIVTDTDAIDVAYFQCENSSTTQSESSPIPTTTAAVTRDADVLSFDAANISATAGTWYAEMALEYTAGSSQFVDGGSTTTGLVLGAFSTTSARMTDGTTAITKSGLTSYLMSPQKIASSYGLAGQEITGGGQGGTTGAFDGAMTATSVRVMGSANRSQTIMNLRGWLAQASSGQLTALTA